MASLGLSSSSKEAIRRGLFKDDTKGSLLKIAEPECDIVKVTLWFPVVYFSALSKYEDRDGIRVSFLRFSGLFQFYPNQYKQKRGDNDNK